MAREVSGAAAISEESEPIEIRSLRPVQAGPVSAGGEHTYSVPSLASPELPIDRSEAFLEDLLLPTLTDVPRDAIGLAGVLFPEQHRMLPVLSRSYRQIYSQYPKIAEKYLRVAEESNIAVLISKALQDEISSPKSEADVSMTVGGYLGDVFRRCNMYAVDNSFLELTFNMTKKRSYSNSTATLSGTRPDTLGIMCQCTFLVGEDEASDLTLAEHDILKKMRPLTPRFYGDLQFILGYIAAGTEFQWVLIGKDGKSLIRIPPCLDLASIPMRVLFLLSIFNVYKLVRKMVERIPRLPGRHAMYSELVEGDRTIVFLSDSVCKKIRNFTGYCALRGTDFNVIKQAYNDVKGYTFLPEVIGEPILERGGSIYQVMIRPLGHLPMIKSEEDTKLLAKSVCEALCVLHRKNFVHRDVRLPNVVQVSDRQFMLIDLETVAKSPFFVHPSFDYLADWSHDMLEDSFYTPKSDLYQLGKLLAGKFSRFTGSPSAQQFIKGLMSKQVDAEKASKDPWLDVRAETQDP